MIRRLLMPAALLFTFALLGLSAPAQDKDRAKTPEKTEKVEKKGDAKIVTLKALLPQANAKLTVEGQLTKLTGETRTFRSPPLEPGVKYVYTLIAEWEPNNYTKIKRTIKKNVEAGQDVEIDFRKPNPDIADDILVRYVPTPDDIVEKMVEMAKITKNDVVYDLGCGDGRMVIAAVKKGGAKRGVGIDIDPQRIAESKANAKQAGVEDKVEFREGDVLKIPDLSDANVVLLYMGEDLNRQLKPILQKTLKPGSRIVSHRFTMGPDWKPDRTETIKGKDGDTYLVHLWTIKDAKKDEPKKEETKKEDVKKDEPKKEGAKKEK